MCGIIGIHGIDNISYDLFHGLRALQHRGQSSAGFITFDGNIYPKKSAGFVDNLFKGMTGQTEITEEHPGKIGIGHTRYSTAGKDTYEALKRNAQPEYLINPFIAACHNGNVINGKEIMARFSRTPRTECDIQWLLLPMADALPTHNKIDFDTIFASAEGVMAMVKGSYSTLFLTAGRKDPYLIGMTDPHKVRPMVVGKKGKDWFIASESSVLKRLGAIEFQDVDSGTIVGVRPGDDKPVTKQVSKKKKFHCMFEYIYFADPASVMEGRSVHKVRVDIGMALGTHTAPEDADVVVPVPESGRRYGIGFSRTSGIPLEEGLRKDRNYRAFIQQTQDQRDQMARDNLAAIDSAIDGMSVVLTDDSLVRGTNLRRVIQKVRDAGARKVHVRIGCPPLVAPCCLGIDMRSKKEFIAIDQEKNELRGNEQIAKMIGADSLAYGSIATLRRAILGFSDDRDICTGCINFPNGYPDDMREHVKEMYGKDMEIGCRAYE